MPVLAGEKLVIDEFKCFGGKHCETTAMRNVLGHYGFGFSEEMLFGIGGGLGFYYRYQPGMPGPFIGTRCGEKSSLMAVSIGKRLNVEIVIDETEDAAEGYYRLKELLRQRQPAVVYGDIAYLPFFALPPSAHFGGHCFIVYGVDETKNEVYISDCAEKPVSISIDNLVLARSSTFHPFPPCNRMLKVIVPPRIINLENAILAGLKECCRNMLRPTEKDAGLAGMRNWAEIVLAWARGGGGVDLFSGLYNTFRFIEISGTGGSAFRPIYVRFLKEASSILNKPALAEVAASFKQSARLWSQIAALALPDDFSVLGQINNLLVEKNRHQKKQGGDAVQSMQQINQQIKVLEKEARRALPGKAQPLLQNLSSKILECYKLEEQAFRKLEAALG